MDNAEKAVVVLGLGAIAAAVYFLTRPAAVPADVQQMEEQRDDMIVAIRTSTPSPIGRSGASAIQPMPAPLQTGSGVTLVGTCPTCS